MPVGQFGGDDEVPAYRTFPAALKLDGIAGNYKVTGQALPPSSLPDFAREHISDEVTLSEGVGMIEDLARQPEIKLAPPIASDLARYLNAQRSSPSRHIDSIYWVVSPSAVRGVLDHIRTALVQLVVELRATMPDDEAIPSPEEANQAIQVVVTGKHSNVSLSTAQAQGPGATAEAATAPLEEDVGFWTRSRRIGAFVVGSATVLVAVIAAIEHF